MKFSQLFTRTQRENPKDEVSINAQLLERGGFVYKNSAGIYTYLPLGWRVLQKIATIIREEMDKTGAMELFMPALVEKKYLDATGRWDVEIGFEARGKKEDEAHYVLGWTHEEVLTEIASKYISSYKDLPFAAYQIQTKFRNEARAKSGLLRGREFIMKDLYSFHTTEEDLYRYYDEVKRAYERVFERCQLNAYYTLAAGGEFTVSNTHEFQVPCGAGEDTIYVCKDCRYAENSEISSLKAGDTCPKCEGTVEEYTSIEVGNIFPLGTKYSQGFNLHYLDEAGQQQLVVMGSYGIGLGRVMGTIVETHHDDKGIVWPESVAPFRIHIVALDGGYEEGQKLYQALKDHSLEVLYDDREDKSAGEKFADADLIGAPYRIIISKKTLETQSAEIKKRNQQEAQIVTLQSIVGMLR